MSASRQSNPAPAPHCAPSRRDRRGGARAFTLIELIFVLALLAISASFIAASMGGFFRGRALNFEARRLLSLTHYGQSRAVSEGVPVVLWINPKDSTYGVAGQSSFSRTGDDEEDDLARSYAAESSLTLEVAPPDNSIVSEQDDEKLGVPEGLAVIRFNPDGFIDETSVRKITIRQGSAAALDLVLAANGLGYEIRPAGETN